MDKLSEKVLKYCVNASCNNLNEPIVIKASDFKIDYIRLNSLCHNLCQLGYLADYEYSEERKPGIAYISHIGLTYFDLKRGISHTQFTSNIVVPIIVTLLTQLIIFASKPLLQQIQELLTRIFQ